MGRYRAVVAGLVICTITVILAQFAFVMLEFNWTPISIFILLIITLIIGIFGFGCFYTIMLPFTLDQMIGASADELSAVVQWYYWELQHCIDDQETYFTAYLLQLNCNSISGHAPSGLPHNRFFESVSCSDNGLPAPQMAGHSQQNWQTN